jgi:phytoene synthase
MNRLKIKQPAHLEENGESVVDEKLLDCPLELLGDEEVLALHGKTFHFAARFFPVELRSAVSTLYAFFRTLDDLVDDPPEHYTRAEIRAELDAWRQWFLCDRQVLAPRVALGRRLHAVLEAHPVPAFLFLDFLEGLFSDLQGCQISTFEDLYHYCYGVAGTVGMAMAYVMNVRSEQALAAALQLGIAMQMTNILRDVGGDLACGRIYLPVDEREYFGCSDAYLQQLYAEQRSSDERFRALMQYQIARAYSYYDLGLHGIWLLPASCRLPILIAGRLYRRILTVIERRHYDVLHRRASTSAFEKAREASVAFLLNRLWKWGETPPVSKLEVLFEK